MKDNVRQYKEELRHPKDVCDFIEEAHRRRAIINVVVPLGSIILVLYTHTEEIYSW